MTNIVSLSDRCRALGAKTTLRPKRHIIVIRMQESESAIPVAESLLTGLFCRCAGNATGQAGMLSTRLAKRLFGLVATLFYGRCTSTPSAATTRKPKTSFAKRHFGFSGEH